MTKYEDCWPICYEIIKWLELAEDMYHRDKELSHAVRELDSAPRDSWEESSRMKKEADRMARAVSTTRHMFLSAFQNSKRWAEALLARDSDVAGEVTAYLSAIEPAIAVRNMREHADEYFLPEKSGKGFRKDFVIQGIAEGGTPYQADATSDISNGSGGDVLIGARVSRENLAGAATNLRKFLQARIKIYEI